MATPSLFELPSGHQFWQWPLKSPEKSIKYGFSFLILVYAFKFIQKVSKLCDVGFIDWISVQK